jgi:P4 family phage/plasmid primase-like protien
MALIDTLSAEHYEEIVVDSAITPAVAEARGYRTLTGSGPDRDELEELGFQRYLTHRDDAYPGLLVPMHGVDGTVRGHQFKPAVPRTRSKADGTPSPVKYESPKGAALCLDVPEFTREALPEIGTPLWITEGMKKTDALVSQGLAALGLTGVFNWRTRMGTLGDWEEIPLKGRTVVVCFDADAAGNRNVQLAMGRLGAWLRSRGVAEIKYIVVPGEVSGVTVKGVDDFFAAGGDVASLAAVATGAAPGAGEKDAAFTDAFLVEELAEELTGRYCWAGGLGWMAWTGRVWKEVPDVEPLEAVRVWASDQFEKVLANQRKDPSRNLQGQISGWRAVLGKSRLTALRDLARGLLQADAADFDSDADLLTCRNGTVHLPTGKLLPFDPEHKTTKMAGVEYIPGARHADWDAALRALPASLLPWYQDRIGQAATGHKTPDHTLVLSYGSGSNGKSTVVDIIRVTLGTYGILVSDRVLMVQGDAHPTEMMDLRGARYAVLEETPEARHLNVQRLKQLVGTPVIRARKIRQDTVEFIATHSLFINTNHKPIVNETDHGTWRRLALLDFPYTFRKPGEPLSGPTDRVGNPRLEYASNDPQVRAAALAWMIEGARAWYARDRMMMPMPGAVEKSTRQWRSETDMIVGFADDLLIFDSEGITSSQEMLEAFNSWAEDRGHRTWNDKTFASRFGGHEIARKAKVGQARKRIGAGNPKRVWTGVRLRKSDDPWEDTMPEPTEPEPLEEPCVCDEPDEVVRLEPQGPNRTTGSVVLGFDLETASAEELFTGGHEGPFVRLAGTTSDVGSVVEPADHYPPQPFRPFLEALDEADVIYGHNILGFDLLALAHHHGADYDRLAEKSIDTLVLARLIDPPMSKGMPNGYYQLDSVAKRLGHAGKTDDIKGLAKKHGGFDRIPLDDPDYRAYLEGDLEATRAVYEGLRMLRMGDEGSSPSNAQIAYAEREMRIVALQNRMTLNGWAVDEELLKERTAAEDAKRAAAVKTLHEDYGVPLAKPDRFRLKLKRDWPQQWSMTDVRALDGETQWREGFAERIPGEVYASPWATDAGRAALEAAFTAAGAPTWPRTPSGQLALSSDALGEQPWYDGKKNRPGMLQIHGDKPAVRKLVETINLATGARTKYAEISKFTTSAGRVHAWIGDAQGSGRWAMTKPSLTNMGKRGAAGEERAVMVAEPGHVLLTCDLSQVDMRAMAGLSQDPAYMALFAPGRDAHMEMAEVYFGQRTPEARQRTKAINHKLNYGGGAKSTAAMNGIALDVVEQAMRERERAYPKLIEYIASVRERAECGQLLDNGFGRMMRPNPERAGTQAPALVGQGAARDIMCESLLRLVDRAERDGVNVRPLLRGVVHDEVVLSVPEADVDAWKARLEWAFTWEWKGVPILCEVGTPAYRWSDCK